MKATIAIALLVLASAARAQGAGPVGLTLKPVLQTTTTISGQPLQFPQADGEFTAVIEAHSTHVFKAGQGFAEIVHSWHNGRNLEDKPVRFLIVFAGRKGTPNLIRP